MKDPVGLSIQFQNEFVSNFQRIQLEIGKFSDHVVVIAREIIDGSAFSQKIKNQEKVFGMFSVPIVRTKIPYIQPITIDDQNIWLYAFQIMIELFGTTTVG